MSVQTEPADEEKASAEALQPTRKVVRLSGAALACGVFLLVATMPLSYLGGLMYGRDEQFRASLPVVPAEESVHESEAADEPKGEMPPEDGAQQDILRAGELAYSRTLRAAPGEKVLEPKRKNLTPVDAEGKPAGKPVLAPGMSPAVPEGPPQPPERPADTFEFVFQVAAVRTQPSADALKGKLEGRGYKTRIEKSGKNLLLVVRAYGPRDTYDTVRRDMAAIGLGAPIARSQRPVFRPVGH